MNRKEKGHADCNQVASNTSNTNFYFTGLASRIKALIITFALWGWLPLGMVDRLINRGEPRDE